MGGVSDILGGGGGSIHVPKAQHGDISAGGLHTFNKGSRIFAGYADDIILNSKDTKYLKDPAYMAAVREAQRRKALLGEIKQNYRDTATGIRGFQPQYDALFDSAIGAYGGFLDEVRPGFGRLTDARVTAIDNARQREQSTLRAGLNQRRVLGSSFADNAMTRQALDFAQQEEEARAQSYLEELDMTRQLTNEKMQIEKAKADTALNNFTSAMSFDRAALGVDLDEMNMMVNLASGIASQYGQISVANAQLGMQAAAASANASNGFLDFAGKLAGTAIGNYLSAPAQAAAGGAA